MHYRDPNDLAHERLHAAGLPVDRVGVLITRGGQLISCLKALADLDEDLPEPALVWQPVETVQS